MSPKIAIIGLGYVGLPLLLLFAENKYQTIGIDTDLKKVKSLKANISYISHIENRRIASNSSYFDVTSDYSALLNCEYIVICLPTPLSEENTGNPDVSILNNSIHELLKYIKNGQTIVIESTTYPGYTREALIKPVENMGLEVGSDVFVCYSPEREDPGNQFYSTQNIPKIVSGATPACLNKGLLLYRSVVDRVVTVSSLEVAEFTKLLENTQRSVNIALVNELKEAANQFNVDIFESIHAAATKPFGFMPYYPGPGVGGHCIPIDPYYLVWAAEKMNVNLRLTKLAANINDFMPESIAISIYRYFRNESSIKLLILGLTYKKNIDDFRESPSLKVLDHLLSKNICVHAVEPYWPQDMIETTSKQVYTSLSSVVLSEYDGVIILTDHDVFDYDQILRLSKIVVDTRGRYNSIQSKKVLRL